MPMGMSRARAPAPARARTRGLSPAEGHARRGAVRHAVATETPAVGVEPVAMTLDAYQAEHPPTEAATRTLFAQTAVAQAAAAAYSLSTVFVKDDIVTHAAGLHGEAVDAAAFAAVDSAQFLGYTAGGVFFALLADSIGRKPALTWAMAVGAASTAAAAASPSLTVYALTKATAGACTAGLLHVPALLLAETLPSRSRKWIGTASMLSWTVGSCALVALALGVHQWQPQSVAVGAFSAAGAAWLALKLPESPRWLAANGQNGRCVEVARELAGQGAPSFAVAVPRGDADGENTQTTAQPNALDAIASAPASIKARLGVLGLGGFGVGLTYFGLSLGVGELAGGLHTNAVLTALAEVPTSTIGGVLIGQLGRRGTAVLAFGGTGALAALSAVPASLPQTALALLAKGGICMGYTVLVVVAPEVMPAALRSAGASTLRLCEGLGGAAASPLLAAPALGGSVDVFGVSAAVLCLAVVAGTLLVLPETRGLSLDACARADVDAP